MLYFSLYLDQIRHEKQFHCANILSKIVSAACSGRHNFAFLFKTKMISEQHEDEYLIH